MGFHATLKEAIECMGIQELKSKQIELIERFVSGTDTFVSLLTAYGKSIIFIEIISVISRQKPHTSDLNSDILTLLGSNAYENYHN